MTITKNQAAALASKIISTADRYKKRRLVYQFWKRNCFLVLGYSTLVKCAVELLKMNESTFYRMLKAEQIAINVCLNGSENVCDDTLRILAKLPNDQQPIAWKAAKATAKIGHKYPTTTQVKQVVDQLLASDSQYFE